jgi:predicted phage terminase large subunit-like protein
LERIRKRAEQAPTGPPKDSAELKDERARLIGSLREFMRAGWHVIERQPLVWGWHNDAMVDHLEAVTRGDIRRLAISVPPGSTKTLTVQVFWPAWEWICDQHPGGVQRPDFRFIFATYAGDLALFKSALFAALVESDWYRGLFGERWKPRPGQWAKRMQANDHGGWRLATSVGGAATGQHADRKVGDDLLKPQDVLAGNLDEAKVALENAWTFWSQTMGSRNTGPHTAEVMMMQRIHELDPIGRVQDDPSWTQLCIPQRYEPKHPFARSNVLRRSADGVPSQTWSDPRTEEGELMCPERFSEADVLKAEHTLGPFGFAAQHQQRPSPAGGSIYLREHYRYWRSAPRGGEWCMSVDCTFKNTAGADFVAIQVWCAELPDFYLIDRTSERLDVLGTCSAIMAMRGKYSQIRDIYVEDAANGPAVVQLLQRSVPGLVLVKPMGGKVVRANASASYHRSGNVLLPDPARAPWVEDYIKQHVLFPFGEHDDDVDAQSQAINKLAESAMDEGAMARAVENMRRLGA